MKRFGYFGALLPVALLGCTQEPGAGEPASSEGYLGPGEIALVDGVRIPESVFRVYTLASLQANADDLTVEGRAEVVDQLVYVQLLANEAERTGLHQERRIAAELELQRLQHLARAMAARYQQENPPTETELRDLYQESLPRLLATRYKTRHILVETEAEASDLISQLDQGADFAQLAREFSIGPTAPDGGNLDWLTPDSVVEPFAQAIQSATPGTPVSAPVQTQYGWHVILVEDVQEQAPPGLDAVRADLVVAVERRKLDAFAASLMEMAEVTLVE